MKTGRSSRRVDSGAVLRAPFAAMQWRLLLLWVALLLLPTAVVSLPFWRALSASIDHSLHVQEWATRFSATMFGDAMSSLNVSAWFGGLALIGMLLLLLLSPFLNAMVVGTGRAGRALGFSHLFLCGFVEYGRMFRLMLWSLVPYAIAAALIGVLMGAADGYGERVVLQSQADRATHVAIGVAVLLFVLAQAVVESSRAAFIVDTGLRSATRALGRGVMQVVRRPISSLLCYVLISLIGYAIALALGVGRVHTPAVGVVGLVLAMLMAQLIVLAIGWTRIARLFALAEVARSLSVSRSGGGLPPAL
ncbi:MAG TPA: hypothetical protein VIL60_01600 [Rhodanobacter sp.]